MFLIFIYGENDAALKPAMGDAIANAMPNADSHLWPGAGHYGFVDRPCWSEFFGVVSQ